MNGQRRIAHFAAVVALGTAAISQGAEPCATSPDALDEPCPLDWTPVNSGLTDLDVRVLAIDPVNKTTLYAGGPAGVFKSIDAGARWRPTGLVMTPYAFAYVYSSGDWVGLTSIVAHLAIDSVNPQTVYAATIWGNGCYFMQRRVFKSTDGGENWTDSVSPYLNGCDNIHSLVMAPTDSATLYLANFDDSVGDTAGPLVRTTDKAATWTWGAYQVLNVLAVDPLDSRTVYAGTFDFEPSFTSLPNGVLKSSDGGMTWAATGLTGIGITALTVDSGTPRTLYAATTSPYGWLQKFRGLFKSTDGGESWAAVNNGLSDLIGTSSTVTAVVVDSVDPNKVYVATSGGGISRSIDAGATWTPFNDGLQSLVVHSLALVAGKPSTLYAGTASGVFKTTAAEEEEICYKNHYILREKCVARSIYSDPLRSQ